jgi:hypothetical protein
MSADESPCVVLASRQLPAAPFCQVKATLGAVCKAAAGTSATPARARIRCGWPHPDDLHVHPACTNRRPIMATRGTRGQSQRAAVRRRYEADLRQHWLGGWPGAGSNRRPFRFWLGARLKRGRANRLYLTLTGHSPPPHSRPRLPLRSQRSAGGWRGSIRQKDETRPRGNAGSIQLRAEPSKTCMRGSAAGPGSS